MSMLTINWTLFLDQEVFLSSGVRPLFASIDRRIPLSGRTREAYDKCHRPERWTPEKTRRSSTALLLALTSFFGCWMDTIMRHSLCEGFVNPASIVSESVTVERFAMRGCYLVSSCILGSRSMMSTCMHLCGLCGVVERGLHIQISCTGSCLALLPLLHFLFDPWSLYGLRLVLPKKSWDLRTCSFDKST